MPIPTFTNLLPNMVLLVNNLGLLPTNTPMFQDYARYTTKTNAQVAAQELRLDETCMTNEPKCDFKPSVLGIDGEVMYGGRYFFGFRDGFLDRFSDKLYDKDYGTNETQYPLTLAEAFAIASTAMQRLGVPAEFLSTHKLATAEQIHFQRLPPIVDGAPGPAGVMKPHLRNSGLGIYQWPIYHFTWSTTNGWLDVKVSSTASNVISFDLPMTLRLYMPSNYFDVLGLPHRPVLVMPASPGNTGHVYKLCPYQPQD